MINMGRGRTRISRQQCSSSAMFVKQHKPKTEVVAGALPTRDDLGSNKSPVESEVILAKPVPRMKRKRHSTTSSFADPFATEKDDVCSSPRVSPRKAGVTSPNLEKIFAVDAKVMRRSSPRKEAGSPRKRDDDLPCGISNPLLLSSQSKKEGEETIVVACPPTPDITSQVLSSVSTCLEQTVLGAHPPTPPKVSAVSSPAELVSSPKPDNSFLVGDIVWAHAVGYPWWPAMLIYDPDTGLFSDSKGRLHVQFFGEKVERAWATAKGTKSFVSSKDIGTFREATDGKKRGAGLERSWHLACQQADEALKLDRFARRSKFTCDFTQQTQEKSPTKSQPSTSCEVTKNVSVLDPQARKRALSLPDDAAALHPSKKAKLVRSASTSIPPEEPAVMCSGDSDKSESAGLKTKKPRSVGKRWLHELHVCLVCGDGSNPEEMVACGGGCGGQFHLECLGLRVAPPSFTCDECTRGISSCGVCRQSSGDLKTCSASGCSKQYHLECLRTFPSTKWPGKTRFVCPLHTCETCCGKDGRMDRCARCPAVFHSTGECLQAGYRRLNDTSIICLRHQSTPQPIHLQYCYECGHTGTVRLNCAFCPQSIEPSCLPDGENQASSESTPGDVVESAPRKQNPVKWICSDCQSGSSLHFGDIVHCKIGVYR